MCKVGDFVNVCFDGTLEMQEVFQGEMFARVTFKLKSGMYAWAYIPMTMVGSTLINKKELKDVN